MYYSSITVTSFLLGLASLTPLTGAAPAPTPLSIEELGGARNAWASDTSKVSQFLSAAPSLTGAALASQAAAAFAAESDEKAQKAVLDKQFARSDGDDEVRAAKAVLERPDTFQAVLDGLEALASAAGAGYSAAQVADAVGRINETRCRNVLPAIDAYFRAVGRVLDNGVTAVANRPDNCPSS
ncbi:hypothetical protein Hte_012015 [Hypoxylon texense]